MTSEDDLPELPEDVPAGPSTALVRRQDKARHLSDDVAMQKLWLATQRREWRSLAVVGADDDVPTLDVATRLAEIAWWYRGQPTNVFDLRELGLRLVEYQLREIAAQVSQGDCVIIALSSIFANPTTIAVATAADAAILCIKLGETRVKGAEKTIQEIGQSKFLGSIAIKPHPKDAKGTKLAPATERPAKAAAKARDERVKAEEEEKGEADAKDDGPPKEAKKP